jgi:site-specific DNA recombinase
MDELWGSRQALNDPAIKDEAAEVLRGLIDKVVLTPRAGAAGLDAVLHGDLARILALCAEAEGRKSPKRRQPSRGGEGCVVSVVAGVGFEPTTFRL